MDDITAELAGIRASIANRFLVSIAIVMLPALLASIYRATTLGWLPVMSFQVALALICAMVAYLRDRLPYPVRAWTILGLLLAVGIAGTVQFGLVAPSFLYLVIAPVMASVFFGVRCGAFLLVGILACIGCLGAVIVSAGPISRIDLYAYETSPSAWVNEFTAVLLVTTALLVTFHAFNNSLMSALSLKRKNELKLMLAVRESEDRAKAMELAAMVWQNSSECMMVTDGRGSILTVNPAFERVTGYSADDVIGRNPRIFHSGHHDDPFYRSMWNDITSTGKWQGEVWNRRKNGEIYPTNLSVDSVYSQDGTASRCIALFKDITERKQSEQIIWRQANFDTLTGLPNRQMAMDRLDQEIRDAHRSRRELTVMLLDLDGFKEVNDTLGHNIGDELLGEVAGRLTACVCESDTVARLGGDEFVIIPGRAATSGDTERMAVAVLQCLSTPFNLGQNIVRITTSLGIAVYPRDGGDGDTLMKHADQAMYAAKSQGRNRISYFTPELQMVAQERMRLINDLRVALAEEQFMVYYQPIVDLGTGQITKAEALLRWRHPTRGMVSPAIFISVAEETGMIIDIGNWVFGQAVQQVLLWRRRLHADFQISVNKSPVQFHGDGSCRIGWVEQIRQAGLPGDSIVVEITEGTLLEDSDVVRGHLDSFAQSGIMISLDDFGTGYSSLSYLRSFKMNYLKIDQSFVKSATIGSNDMVLCEAIIVMAHKLGIKVVAEGVETVEQRDLLRAIGCDFAQGFLYSPPLPVDDFEKLVAGRQPSDT